MKKLKILLLALAATISLGAWAQKDVTSTYLVNPSFENGSVGEITSLDGWTLPNLGSDFKNISLGNKSSCVGNGYGITTPSDGNQYFYNRKGWSAVTSSLSQMVKLPAGKYYISVDYKAVQKGGTTSKLGFAINDESIITCKPFFAHSETTGTTMTDDPWKTLGAWFDVVSETDVKIEITETLEGSSARADLCLDNVRLYKWDLEDANNYDNATSTSPLDVTMKFVNNPYFDDNLDGWTSTTGAQNNARATNQAGAISGGFWENWNGQGKTSGKMYKTLSNLPDGRYRLTAAAFADQGNPNVSLFIGEKKIAVTNAIPSFYSIEYNVVGGTTEIGLVLGEGNEAKWIGIDNIKLEYMGYNATEALAALAELIASAPVSTKKHSTATKTALSGAIDAAQALVDAGTGTKTQIETAYTNLATAIANANASIADYANLKAAIDLAKKYTVIDETYETLATTITTAEGIYNNGTVETCAETIAGLDEAVKAAKVADYTYVSDNYSYRVDLGTWKEEGQTGKMKGQHWSGDTEREYLEQSSAAWGWNSWSLSYNQDVTLPAGNYVFKVAGRKAVGDGCTLSLVVKNGEDIIGSISNFPEGDTGLGINKVGATSFDSGDTNGFANNNNGRGFQWRYVKFALTEDAKVNVAVAANATIIHQWVSFCDATIQTDNEANLAMIAYNIALNDAKLAKENDAYKNVTGAELTALNTAMAFETAGKTKTEIDEATAALQDATSAFKAAAPAYDNYKAVLAKVENLDDAGKAKFNELAADINGKYGKGTIWAADLANVTDFYIAAVKAQTTPNTDWTVLIKNNSFETGNIDGWINDGVVKLGALNTSPANNPKVGDWFVEKYWGEGSIDFNQTINDLPVGYYKVTVHARNEADAKAYLYANDEKVAFVKNTTDTYSVNVVIAKTGALKIGVSCENHINGVWLAVDHFTLTYLGATANMTITDANWGTFCAPFDVTIPEGVKAYTAAAEGNPVTFTEVTTTIPAGTPVVVYSATEVNEEFNGKATATGETCTEGALVGVYAAKSDITAEANHTNYVLQSNTQGVGFYKVAEGSKISLNANRCYMTLATSFSAKDCVVLDGIVTGINNILNPTDKSAEGIYDLNGRKLAAPQKGINIINGVKVIVK